MKDDFGDRMKLYEKAEAGRRLVPLLPVCARIDGRNFSQLTKNLERPYDKAMSDAMTETAKWIAEETNALMAYTQSDEISLVWHSEEYSSQIFFDGKIQKMTSILAAMISMKFFKCCRSCPWDYPLFECVAGKLPVFDCRVWNVPNRDEAANVFLWREKDATKNSISMAARHYYSHKELHGKSGKEMQEMLFQKGVNWNDYPDFFKRGTFIQRTKVKRRFTQEELDKIPEKHWPDPETEIERTEYKVCPMSSFTKVSNRPEVILDGAEPVIVGEFFT